MPARDRIIDDLNFTSSTISQQVRVLSGGVLVSCWALLVETEINESNNIILLSDIVLPMMLAFFAMFFDLMHYFCSFFMNLGLLRKIEMGKSEVSEFSNGSRYYIMRQFFFYGKLLCIVGSLLWLFALISFRVGASIIPSLC